MVRSQDFKTGSLETIIIRLNTFIILHLLSKGVKGTAVYLEINIYVFVYIYIGRIFETGQ